MQWPLFTLTSNERLASVVTRQNALNAFDRNRRAGGCTQE